MDMRRKINTCLFMSMVFTSIQIKFDIEINNDELLENIWEHKKSKKTWSSLVVRNNMEPKVVNNIIDWNIIFTTLVSLKSMKTFHGDWSSQRATMYVVARLLVTVFFKWFFAYKGLSKGSRNECYIKKLL